MVYGDAMEWMERFARKGRRFDVVIVDPPSSSTSRRGSKRWVAERDLHGLVQRAADVCAPGGTIFVSTNLRSMSWERFDEHLPQGLAAAARQAKVAHKTLTPAPPRRATGRESVGQTVQT